MIKTLIISALLCCSLCIFDIEQFGAVPDQDHLSAQLVNTKAIISAVRAANSSLT